MIQVVQARSQRVSAYPSSTQMRQMRQAEWLVAISPSPVANKQYWFSH